MRRPKVLIRTLPLENGNYGGIVQAYALQRVLRDMGADPVTDISRVDAESKVKARIRKLAVDAKCAPTSWVERVRHDQVASALANFVFENLDTIRLFDFSRRLMRRHCEDVDLFLAGSDQVWRRRYADVPSYMFDFVQNGPAVLASYAASFGTPSLAEYDDELVRKCAPLLRRFDAVSVREASAVDLCAETFGVVAETHIDPTLLLSAEQYGEIAPVLEEASDTLTTYILDTSEELASVLQELAERLNTPLRRLSYSHQGSQKPLSVEGWLAAYRDARYIITDSFHGTVFAIIHRIPFVTIVNEARGRARFDSLLGLFGLRSSLFEPHEIDVEAVVARLSEPFGWESIERIRLTERDRALSYLESLVELARARVDK